jgi:hypothetical protein
VRAHEPVARQEEVEVNSTSLDFWRGEFCVISLNLSILN